jgi:hypothetical protein
MLALRLSILLCDIARCHISSEAIASATLSWELGPRCPIITSRFLVDFCSFLLEAIVALCQFKSGIAIKGLPFHIVLIIFSEPKKSTNISDRCRHWKLYHPFSFSLIWLSSFFINNVFLKTNASFSKFGFAWVEL